MSKSAFFYEQPAMLDREAHRQLKVKPMEHVRFAAESCAVPILTVEWADSCLEFPLIFSKGQDAQWMALAVTGVKEGRNLFVDSDGRWTARYVPAVLRRYPFVLVKDEAKPDQLGVAIDLASESVGTDIEGGLALFDENGAQTNALDVAMQLLTEFQTQSVITHQFIERLANAGLLTETNIEVKGRQGQLVNLKGSWVVNEVKFRELPDEQVLSMFKTGEVGLIYAHLYSLRNLITLVEKQAKEAMH